KDNLVLNPGNGKIQFLKGKILNSESKENLQSRLLNVDQSNTTVVYNEKFYLKIYRRIFREINPDFELTYFLSEKTKFKNSPVFAGSITWRRDNLPDISIGLMQQKIEHQTDAWTFQLQNCEAFFARLLEEN